MAYSSAFPADNAYIADIPAAIRQKGEDLRTGRVVDAGFLSGSVLGNASGNIPYNNGVLNVNLNAQFLNGNASTAFATSGHVHAVATTSVNGFMSNTDKTKLDSVATGAEVNQNAFSNIVAGGYTIQADLESDTLTIAEGSGIDITSNTTTDTITIGIGEHVHANATGSAAGFMSAAHYTAVQNMLITGNASFASMVATSVDINGGYIDGTIIGQSARAAGYFSALNVIEGNMIVDANFSTNECFLYARCSSSIGNKGGLIIDQASTYRNRVYVGGTATTNGTVYNLYEDNSKTQYNLANYIFGGFDNISPIINNVTDLGLSATKFKNGYFAGTLYAGTLDSTAGLTVGGYSIINSAGIVYPRSALILDGASGYNTYLKMKSGGVDKFTIQRNETSSYTYMYNHVSAHSFLFAYDTGVLDILQKSGQDLNIGTGTGRVVSNNLRNVGNFITGTVGNATWWGNDLAHYAYESNSFTGYITINTNISLATSEMFRFKIEGFEYGTLKGHFDITVSGYAYNSSSVLYPNVIYSGKNDPVVSAYKDSSNKLVLVLESRNWSYPKIRVTNAMNSFSASIDSLSGWTISTTTSLSAYTFVTNFNNISRYMQNTADALPATTNAYDLGSSTYQWQDLYLYNSLYIQGTQRINNYGAHIIPSYAAFAGNAANNSFCIDSTSGNLYFMDKNGVYHIICAI